GRALRRLGRAGALQRRGPCGVQIASLDDRVRTPAHALSRRRDRMAQLRATRPRRAERPRWLVDFWTLTCINWLRTEPYIRAWSRAYRGDGLIVIGVHTPEFSFEHDIDLVRRATEQREIDYPVVADNDYEVWSAFDNHYWPALYFVDEEGV